MAVMAVGSPVKTITLSDLDGITLSLGNSDKKQQWGRKTWRSTKGTPVTELQSALVAVGLLEKADGDFGEKTKVALQRFQWYGQNMCYALKVAPGAAPLSGMITPFGAFRSAALPGTCDQGLACQLLAWNTATFLVTTPLVRVNLAGLANVRLADSFRALDYPFSGSNEVLLHADFVGALETINDEAAKQNVTVLITQAFRREGVPVTGAVVTPADNSPHLVGHAVDWNILDGDVSNGSEAFKNGTETAAADAFVAAVKKAGYRWGGDFKRTDPVHFDDNPYQNVMNYEMTRYFAQHSFRASHPMRLVNWGA